MLVNEAVISGSSVKAVMRNFRIIKKKSYHLPPKMQTPVQQKQSNKVERLNKKRRHHMHLPELNKKQSLGEVGTLVEKTSSRIFLNSRDIVIQLAFCPCTCIWGIQ